MGVGSDKLPLSPFVVLLRSDYSALRARAGVETGDAPHEIPIPANVLQAINRGYSATRAWRMHRGLSLEEVAARAGVSAAVLILIEATTRLRPAMGQKLAVALGVRVEHLLACQREWLPAAGER